MAKATISEIRQSAVAGFVKGGRPGKDGSVTFWIAKVKFVLSQNNIFVPKLRKAKRALLCYEAVEGSRNPKVTLVLTEPSVKLIREYMED